MKYLRASILIIVVLALGSKVGTRVIIRGNRFVYEETGSGFVVNGVAYQPRVKNGFEGTFIINTQSISFSPKY